MSDLTAIELILVILVGGQLSFFLSVARLKQWVDEIAIGVVGGVSVSLRHRSMMLWNTWMPLNFFVGDLRASPSARHCGARSRHHECKREIARLPDFRFLWSFFCGHDRSGRHAVGLFVVGPP